MAEATLNTEIPSKMRLLAAQVAGIGGMLVLSPVTTFFAMCFWAGFLQMTQLDRTPLLFSVFVIGLFMLGVNNAFTQRLVLHPWITNRGKWILSYGISMVILLGLMYEEWRLFAFMNRQGLKSILDETPGYSIILPNILIAIPVGYFGGLIIGAIQTRFLNRGKLNYAISTGIAWCLLFPIFMLYISWMFID
jgi:hypothetical protein